MVIKRTFGEMRDYNEPEVGNNLLMAGIVAGIAAGVIFAMAEMVINTMLGEPFFEPLRMISSIGLGTQALSPDYSLAAAGAVGLLIHVTLSGLYGAAFAGLLSLFNMSRAPAVHLLASGTMFGFLLWIVNFIIIAPEAFPQFLEVNQFWNGFVAHTFFFGTALGWLVASIRPPKLAITEGVSESFARRDEQQRAA